MIRLISIALVTLLGGASAHAGLLLEPYAGYYSSTLKQTGAKDIKATGLGYGARVGFEKMGFMAGIDYMTGAMTDDMTPKDDVTPTDIGLFVGYDFPILLRIWGEYDFTHEAKLKSSSVSGTEKGGSAIKVGAGFSVLPLLSINLEYQTGTYTKWNSTSLTNDVTSNTIGLSVSVPFNL